MFIVADLVSIINIFNIHRRNINYLLSILLNLGHQIYCLKPSTVMMDRSICLNISIKCLTYTPGGVGVTLIFSYIRRLGSFFWVQNFEFQYFWGFQKIFLGMKILWIFFGGHHKIGLYLGVSSMHFRVDS